MRRSPGVETGSEAPNSNDNDNDNGNDASDGGDGASGGSKKRSGGADERRAREMRRDVEKKVELLKGMVREFDEEVCMHWTLLSPSASRTYGWIVVFCPPSRV